MRKASGKTFNRVVRHVLNFCIGFLEAHSEAEWACARCMSLPFTEGTDIPVKNKQWSNKGPCTFTWIYSMAKSGCEYHYSRGPERTSIHQCTMHDEHSSSVLFFFWSILCCKKHLQLCSVYDLTPSMKKFIPKYAGLAQENSFGSA
jgi:hypothetical protein